MNNNLVFFKKKSFLFIFFSLFLISLSACGEEDDYDGRLRPIYEDPLAPEEENTSKGGEQPEPSPDDSYQRITKISYLMPQFSSSKSMQGSALYGNFLFQFVTNNSCIFVYDIDNKKYLGAISCKTNNKWHNNQATFGHVFYEEGDEFPLLYTSQIVPSEQSIQVWRVLRTEKLTIMTNFFGYIVGIERQVWGRYPNGNFPPRVTLLLF